MPMPMTIAISGAGIAGPTLAYWLRRGGHTPVLIERAPALRTGGYVIDFWGVGFDVACRMGIERTVRDIGYDVEALIAVNSDGRPLSRVGVDAFRRVTGNRYTSIARSDLAAAITDTLSDDVEMVFGDTITAIEDRGDGVGLSLAHGPDREVDLVIGADGLHSTVRRLTFGPDDGRERYLGCVVAACVVDGYRPRTELGYVTYNVPGRQVGRFALRDDRTLFLFVGRTAHPGELPADADVATWLQRAFGDVGWECPRILDAVAHAEDVYFDVVAQIRMDRWSRGRVALVGDAAACPSLLAGEGTGLAMAEAYVLAGELVTGGGDHTRAFAAYERLLKSFVADKQDSALRFLGFFATHSRLGLWLRDLGLRVASVPAIADLVVKRSFHDDIELPDYGY